MVDLAEIQAAYYMVAATGVLVAAIYYVFNMKSTLQVRKEANVMQRQQLETRQAQLFMQMYDKVSGLSFMREWGRLMDAQWSSYDDWLERYGKDTTYRDAFWMIDASFEGFGVFVKEKLVDIRLVALFIAGAIRMFWEKYRSVIEEERKRLSYPRFWDETEYLYNELMKYMELHPELKT